MPDRAVIRGISRPLRDRTALLLTWASLMLAQGTPLHVVSEVLGHASIANTKDVYGHLLEGDKRAAAESMSRARSEGLEPPTF